MAVAALGALVERRRVANQRGRTTADRG
ncbi:hypothetical protein [Nocardia sp. NPDC049707]